MNLEQHELESLLRSAPSPRVPPSLEAELKHSIAGALPGESRNGRPAPRASAAPSRESRGNGGRWWPLILSGLAAAAFGSGVAFQQAELTQLRDEVQALEQRLATPSVPSSATEAPVAMAGIQPAVDGRLDLERLRALLATLEKEVGALEEGREANDRLRAAIKALEAELPKDLQTMSGLGERALAIKCVNNMKQLGLAVRVWATDNADEFPPDVLSMTNELATPNVLVCPADETRSAAPDWASYTAANLSYEFLSPGPGKFEIEPNRLMFRCPIHGTITLCDGSVQMGMAKEHPEWIQASNGAWYVVPHDPPSAASPGGGGGAGPAGGMAGDGGTLGPAPGGGSMPGAVGPGTQFRMDPVLARRYGLVVSNDTAQPDAGGTGAAPTEDPGNPSASPHP